MNNKQIIISLWTITRKEVGRIFRIWPQTIVPPIITSALYFVVFGAIVGRKVGEVHGFPYIVYIIPGVIMNIVIINSFSNTASSFFLAKFNHSIEELIVSPMPNWVIILGYMFGSVVRGVIIGSLVLFISFLFVSFRPANLGFTIGVFFLSAGLFASLGFLNALWADKFDDISWIPSFIITPLTYLGGVFYSIDILPALWQQISFLNPILYVVNAFRFGMIGYSSVDPYKAVLCLVMLNIISYAVNLWLMNIGFRIKQ